MIFHFPRIKFVTQNGIVAQLEHLKSEVVEAIESSATPDIWHTAEEVMDAYHSAESSLRVLAEKYAVDLDAVKRKVIQKNIDREYYI